MHDNDLLSPAQGLRESTTPAEPYSRDSPSSREFVVVPAFSLAKPGSFASENKTTHPEDFTGEYLSKTQHYAIDEWKHEVDAEYSYDA